MKRRPPSIRGQNRQSPTWKVCSCLCSNRFSLRSVSRVKYGGDRNESSFPRYGIKMPEHSGKWDNISRGQENEEEIRFNPSALNLAAFPAITQPRLRKIVFPFERSIKELYRRKKRQQDCSSINRGSQPFGLSVEGPSLSPGKTTSDGARRHLAQLRKFNYL